MGSVNVTETVATAYGDTYTVSATITWDSTPTVTVNAWCSDSSKVWGWRIRGRASQGDSTVYAIYTGNTSFTATNNKDYVFQGVGGSGTWSNGTVFTVTDGSSSGGEGGGGGTYVPKYITITQGDNTELTVTRTYCNGNGLTGVLSSGAEVWHGDGLEISCSALTGYELDSYANPYNNYPTLNFYVNYYIMGGPSSFTVYCIDTTSPAYPEVRSSAHPKQYVLSLSQGQNSSIAVTRMSSKNSDASIGEELQDGDTIYHFDELQINFKPNTGYEISTHTVNGQSFTSGGTIEVAGDVSIISDASIKTYTLTLDLGTGSEITVNRMQSPLQNATVGVINSNETIYYADVLKIILSSSPEYEILEQYVNQEEFASGDIFEVQDDITVKTITRLRGIAHIHNGTLYNKYLIYIFNNGSWSQYISYVYKDSKWNICS